MKLAIGARNLESTISGPPDRHVFARDVQRVISFREERKEISGKDKTTFLLQPAKFQGVPPCASPATAEHVFKLCDRELLELKIGRSRQLHDVTKDQGVHADTVVRELGRSGPAGILPLKSRQTWLPQRLNEMKKSRVQPSFDVRCHCEPPCGLFRPQHRALQA